MAELNFLDSDGSFPLASMNEEAKSDLPADDPSAQDTPVDTQDKAEEPSGTDKSTDTPPDAGDDFLDTFNSRFESNFSTVDELKDILGATRLSDDDKAKLSSYEEKEKKLELLVSKYKELSDPKTYFPNETKFKESLLLKENPHLNGDVAGKIFSADLEKSNPLDIIALDMMLKHSKIEGGEAGAKALFLARNGIDEDFDFDDLSTTQKNIINLAAEDAAKNIVSLRDGVEIPDHTKTIEELLGEEIAKASQPKVDIEAWKPKVNDIVGDIKAIEIKDGDEVLYSEDIPSDFKEGLDEAILETVEKGGLEPTEENISALKEEAIMSYYWENKDAIFKRYRAELEAKMAEKYHNENHNDRDPDKVEQTPTPEPRGKNDWAKILGL